MSFEPTIPISVFRDFKALYQGKADGLVNIFPIAITDKGIMMAIPSEEGVTYISAAQAKAFFGFS